MEHIALLNGSSTLIGTPDWCFFYMYVTLTYQDDEKNETYEGSHFHFDYR